jgi:hypothetical protein
MPDKMHDIDAETQTSTKLGYCLQNIVALCLRGQKLVDPISENVAYTTHAIKPDIFVGPVSKPLCSIHVTSSDSRESFRMKRWRYVCEIFQLKKYCRTVHSVNVFWGTPDLYQPGDIHLLELLFDSSIDLRSSPEGQLAYKEARKRIEHESVGDVSRRIYQGLSKSFCEALADHTTRAILSGPKASNSLMWAGESNRKCGMNDLPNGRESTWTAPFLRSLLLTSEEFAGLESFARNPQSVPSQVLLDLEIVATATGIITRNLFSDEFRQMVSNGLARTVRDSIMSSKRYKQLISEARSLSGMRWPATIFRLLQESPTLTKARELIALSERHPRLLAIDGIIAMWGVAANSLEPLWDDTICRTGVKNPIANLVSRTALVGTVLDQRNVSSLAKGILHLWKTMRTSRGEPSLSLEEFKARIIKYRRFCLFGQKTLKPIPYVVKLAIESHGWRANGKARYVFSRGSGGGVGTEFQHTYRRGSSVLMVKSLFGGKGADHKAEEMAGRLFLLPYVQDGLGAAASHNALGIPLFLPEGRWKGEQLSLLASAGWNVAATEGLSKFLANLST